MVFYRKYRPQTLSELIGEDHIRQALLKAAQNKTLAHAYLFCGTRGTGKTSTARILAKIVNCKEPQDPEMLCGNKCDSCKAISEGSSLDVIEIDAASNRGIDDIRALRENIKLSASNSHKKVYIIDEVHMLSNEAFNALLKTLEEPPSHVIFVLATTEAHKIPQTILSRVVRYDFKQASVKDLISAIKRVVESEKLEIDSDVLELIAKKADGSFRDALKLLDQLASQGTKVTKLIFEQSFNSGSLEDLNKLLNIISKKDTSEALGMVQKQIESGVNLKDYILSLMSELRLMLLLKNGAATSIKDEISEDKFNNLTALAERFSTEGLINLLNNLQTAFEKMKVVSIPSLPLEIAIIESTSQEISNIKYQISSQPRVKDTVTENAQASRLENIVVAVATEQSIAPEPIPEIESKDMAKLLDKWNYILETIKPYNFSLEALLRQVKVVSCTDGKVLLEVPYLFHQRILEAPKSRDLLESVFSDVLGKPSRVACILGTRPTKVEELANVEVAADDDVIRLAAEIFNSEPAN